MYVYHCRSSRGTLKKEIPVGVNLVLNFKSKIVFCGNLISGLAAKHFFAELYFLSRRLNFFRQLTILSRNSLGAIIKILQLEYASCHCIARKSTKSSLFIFPSLLDIMSSHDIVITYFSRLHMCWKHAKHKLRELCWNFIY